MGIGISSFTEIVGAGPSKQFDILGIKMFDLWHFRRVLGKYVREEKIMPLEEAIRKMTSLPAERFGLARRGRLAEGFFADVVVFDSARVRDRATFAEPHQYADGFEAVLVNGVVVFERGERAELPGKVIRGSLATAIR